MACLGNKVTPVQTSVLFSFCGLCLRDTEKKPQKNMVKQCSTNSDIKSQNILSNVIINLFRVFLGI